VPIELDFTERRFTETYFTLADMLTVIGGYKAALQPIF
jgi:hypothetical protein